MKHRVRITQITREFVVLDVLADSKVQALQKARELLYLKDSGMITFEAEKNNPWYDFEIESE